MDFALIISIFVFILALNFGSFTNVLIYRIPRKDLSINKPARSFCPNCKAQLKFWENIPLLSYILLSGKCRYCSAAISIRYPSVELIYGLVSLPFIYRFIFLPLKSTGTIQALEMIFTFAFLAIIIALAFIDHLHKELPHELTYTAILIGLVHSALFGNFLHSLASVGAIFLLFDFFTHFTNKLYYKNKALSICSSALSFRNSFLAKHITKVYLCWAIAIASLYFFQQNLILEYLLIMLGALYIINEIFLDFLFYKNPSEESTEETEYTEQTVMGGGDVAMMAFIASLFYIKDTLLIILMSFYLAVIFAFSQKIYGHFTKNPSKDKHVPLGGSLSVSLIAAMILTVLNEFK